MNKKLICRSLAPTLLLLACGRPPTAQNEADPRPTQAPSSAIGNAAVVTPPANASTDSSASNSEGSVNLAPPVLTPEAERGPKGVQNVLLSFARAIEQQKFDQAWSLLSPADQRKWSRQQFAGNFSGLKGIIVAIPTGTTEGAAGSIYYTAPVTITGTDENGRPIRAEGEAVLKRVNDVDGATSAQLRWHFNTLTLDWTHERE